MSKEQPIINNNATIAYFADTGAMVTRKDKPRPIKEKDPETNKEMAYWGDMNDFPQQIDSIIRKNADFGSMLNFLSGMLYAGGIDYHVKTINDDGTFQIEKKYIHAAEQFKKRNWHYAHSAVNDIFRYINIFPSFTLTKDGEEIYWLTCKPAKHCRLAKQKDDGSIPAVYVSANWDEINDVHDEYVKKYPLIPYLTGSADWLRENKGKQYSWIYHLAMPTGNTYYQLAHWYGLVESKWLDLANEIPKFKIAVMQNQITIKYHVEMPDYWMDWKYPNWDRLASEKQKELTEAEFKNFNDFLKGSEKAGKTITSTFKTDKHSKEAYPGWKITPIDDKIKDGLYLEDSTEATMKMFAAIGLDPALFGVVPGKGGSNRSGSDKREAMNIAISFLQRQADIVLKPYELASDYNGWNTEKQQLLWHFKKPYLQTLDQVKPEERKTVIQEGGDGE